MARLPIYRRYIQYINNRPYIVHATYPIDKIKDVSLVKEWLGVDSTFKDNRNGVYIFCEEIEDAKII